MADPANVTSDNNTFSGGNIFSWNGGKTLTTWQATNRDQNSYSCEPQFANTSSLHLLDSDLCARNRGISLLGFDSDIDGEVRGNQGLWDIGADEYYINSNVRQSNLFNYVLSECTLYPNPTNSFFNVQFSQFNNEPTVYRITNMLGAEMLMGKVTSSNFSVDIEHISSGIYNFTIQSSKGIISKRIEKI